MKAFGIYLKVIVFATVVAVATGCASFENRSVPPYLAFVDNQLVVLAAESDADFDSFDEFGDQKPVYDPLEGYNRFMFGFNDGVYVWVLRPLGKGYAWVVPQRARVCVKAFFKNVFFPIRFVNNLLQLKFKRSGVEIARFGINSTLGLAGLFDPAAAWFHLEESDEDFGQTLGKYGVGPGVPIVLPILGPSNLRDAFSLIPDSFLNPISYVTPSWKSVGLYAGEKFNYVSLYSDEYDELKKSAVDPYVFFRNAYMQSRTKEVEK